MKFKINTYTKHANLKHQPKSEFWTAEDSADRFQFLFFDNVQHLCAFVDENITNRSVSFSLPSDPDGWCFGRYFQNHAKTKQYLSSGLAPKSLIAIYEAEKQQLYTDNPELFDLTTMARKKKRRRTFGEEGAELNIDRYMSGEVEMWERTTRVNKKPTVKINISTAISAQTNNEDLVKNICAAVAFIDILAAAGISCEVWYSSISFGATSATTMCATFAKVKEADSPVDVSRLLSCSAPGLQRYYDFRVMDFAIKGRLDDGCGMPASASQTEQISKIHDFDLSLHAGGHLSKNLKFITEKLKELLS